jgi:hypothetical protein
MVETIALDPKTVILKSDNERELSEILGIIGQKDKTQNITSFLKFASQNRIIDKNFKFVREECYGR